MQKLSLITTHFYDFSWINCWIDRINEYTQPGIIQEIIVINQDRNNRSKKLLENLDSRIRAVEYPISLAHFEKLGHDHPYVLNLAVQEAQGDFIGIFDSDCHPFDENWVAKCDGILEEYDAITAVDYYAQRDKSMLLSHPCFMILKKEHASLPISFDAGLFDENYDTGRLVGRQLQDAGAEVYYAQPEKAFSGYWGWIYLNSIYHHERGSYQGGDARLTGQIDWRQQFFQKIVIHRKRYQFSDLEYLYYRYRHLKRGRIAHTVDFTRHIPEKLTAKMRKTFQKK